MKKLLFKALFAIGLFTSINSINAQCSLDQVGAPNYSTTCALSDMAAAPTGSVYVVSYNSTLNKIFLHSAVTSGSWAPLASISTSLSIKPIVAVNKANGKVYVVIRDESGGKVCKVYYLSGGSLLQLGTAVSGSNIVTDLSIAFNSLGEEFVAYTDASNSNFSTVKKWNGSAWVTVGTTGIASTGVAHYNSLMLDNSDTPIIAFQDATTAPANKISVMKCNGTNWVSLGVVSSNPAINCVIKTSSIGNYVLGYVETSTTNGIVQTYNGSSWSALGSPVSGLSSSANSFDLDLDPNDQPTFISILSTPPYPVAYKYTGVPTWSNTIGGGYLNSTTCVNPNVGFDATGNPYYFYVDQTNNNGLNVKTISSPITISSQPLSVTRCNGQSGTFNLGVVGGTPSYQWQTTTIGSFTNAGAPYSGATSNALSFTANSSLNQNQIRCVVNTGCKNIISNTATLTVSTLSVTSTFTNPTCFNTGDGAISVTVNGGVSPYSYTWSPVGGNTANPTGLYWNTYTLNATDINGCPVSSAVTLTSPPSISTSFSGNMNICNGSNTTLTITATGGTPGYTYSWTPGGSLSTTTSSVVIANPSSSQTYNVSVTDALGCVATDTVMVNVTALPTLTTSPNSTVCAGSLATINVSGAHTYTWNPGNLVGALQNVNPVSTTIYTVVGTNTLSGCTNSATTTVFVNPLPTVNAGPSRTLTCANTSTTLAGSTAGGITYSWTGPGIVSGATTLNPTINATGTYDLTVTSAFGCVAGPSPVSVFQDITPPTPTASNSTTLTCSTTTAALTSSGGGTYVWSGPGIASGGTTANPVINLPGCYTVVVSSAVNGCTASANTCVTQNTLAPSITANASPSVICNGNISTLMASGANTYTWNPGAITGTSVAVAPTTSTTYTVAGTNTSNGCQATITTTVIVNALPTLTIVASPTVICSGSTATLTGSGANTYTWNPGALTTASVAVSPASTTVYTLTGLSVAGCVNTKTISLTVNAIPTLTTNANGSICTGQSYTLSAIGASSYVWNPGSIPGTTVSVSPASTTVYTVSGTTSGCTGTKTISVTVTALPTANAGPTRTLTCANTSTTLAGSGTGIPTYTWTGPGVISGSNTATPTINLPGTYTLVVKSSGCNSTPATVVISQNTVAPSPSASTSGTITCTSPTVSLNSTPAGSYTYLWAGPGIGSTTTQNTSASAAGIYSVTVTAISNGCSATATTAVTQNTVPPSPTASTGGTLTCTIANVSLTGTGGGIYNWSGPAIASGGTTASPIVTAPGCYTVNVTAVNGCTANAVTCVTQNTVMPSANAGMDQILTCSSPTTTLSGSASPSSCTPVWTGGVASGANSYNATVSAAGDYTLTVTDPNNGCYASDNVQVTVNATIPTVSLSANTATITCSSPTISIIASTTMSPVSYSWSPSGGTTASEVFSMPGSYSLVVTSLINGCSTSPSANVVNILTDISIPTISIAASPSIICSGNTSTLTASSSTDPNTDYMWSPGSLNGSTQNVSPLSTTLYSVVVTNTVNGCVGTETINLTVNSTPTIAITGNTTICNGSTTTLIGSGATSYTWDSGANTATISVTPSITTTYTLTGDNGSGCSSSLPVTVSIIPNKSISGVITSTAGATGGDIIIYKYTAALSHWDSLTITPIGGTYSFNNIDSGLYVLRAIPTATNVQVTYAPNAISWQGATVINHGCTNNTSQNIDLVGFAPFVVGPGVLTGQIVEAFGYVPRMSNESKPMFPGQPIGGIIVKGGKNPGGQMLVQTITATDGTYTLTGLPINTLPDDYFVFVDIPGLDTNGTYHISIASGTSTITGLDFNVDAQYINPIGSVTAISNDNSVLNNKVLLFPNPASQKFTLEYELIHSANVEIELYNVIGDKVKTITRNSFEEKNKYSYSVNLENVSNGVYFVKLKINDSNTIIKLVVSE